MEGEYEKSVESDKQNNKIKINEEKESTLSFKSYFKKHIVYFMAPLVSYILVLCTSLLRGGKEVSSVLGINPLSFLGVLLLVIGELLLFLLGFSIIKYTRRRIDNE